MNETDQFDAVGVVLDLREVKLGLTTKIRRRGLQQWIDLFALVLLHHDVQAM